MKIFLLEKEIFLLEKEIFLLEKEIFLLEKEIFLLEKEFFLLGKEFFLLEMNRLKPLKRPNSGQNRGLRASGTAVFVKNRHFHRFSPRTGLGPPEMLLLRRFSQ